MSYIGNTATQQAFTPAVDFFNGNGSTTAFTLSRPVASVAQVQAVISNVPQKPGDAFTVNGNTITFTSAPPSGTQNIYVYYTSPITQVIAPGQNTVSPASLSTGAPSWDTSGNVTTTGTINNLTVGRGAGSVSTNTAVGASALAANTSGTLNTGVGSQANKATTTGDANTAVGADALLVNTTGSNNSAFGYASLKANTTGAANTAYGQQTLFSNTTASLNTAVGYQAMYSNTTGTSNAALGYQALYTATTANQNTAVGRLAMVYTTTGSSNTGIGHLALYENTTGGSNTALGDQALRLNTTASNNTAVGYQAGYSGTTATENALLGQGAGYSLTSGSYNVVVGRVAGYNITTGNFNTIVGMGGGDQITTGSKNTIFGRYNGNQGGLDIRTASNYIVLSDGDGNPRFWTNGSGILFTSSTYANTTANAANIYVGSANGSFERSTSALKYKQNIRDLEEIDINLFRPVRYNSKCDNDDKTKDHFGIISDEVHDAGITELVNYNSNGEVEGFQYERLTVVLLKKLQVLESEFKAYKEAHP